MRKQHHTTKPPSGTDTVRVTCRGTFDATGASQLARVMVLRDGRIKSKAGDFVVDAEAARLTIAAFNEHDVQVPWDYEHQTEGGKYARADGKAPAIAWIHRLEYVPGEGIYAHVHDRDEEAVNMIVEKRYKYFSPTVYVRKTDRRVVGLRSVGLTNMPAIVGSEALVNAHAGENDMPDANETPIDDAVNRIREVLGLDDSADLAAILKAALDRLGGADDTEAEAPENKRIAHCVREFCSLPETADHGTVDQHLNGMSGELRTLNAEKVNLENRIDTLHATVREAEQKNRELQTHRIIGHPDHKGKMSASSEAYEAEQLLACKTQAEFEERVEEFNERMARTRPRATPCGT